MSTGELISSPLPVTVTLFHMATSSIIGPNISESNFQVLSEYLSTEAPRFIKEVALTRFCGLVESISTPIIVEVVESG
jgi:hypothetical protein